MKILFKNRKTIEFLSGLDELSANAEMIQILEIEMNVPLTPRESLWVKYESADKSFTATKEHLIAHNLVDTIPEEVLRISGEWKLQLFIREYDSVTGGYITKSSSNIAKFTMPESLQLSAEGSPITTASVLALYNTAAEKIAIETNTAQKIEGLDQSITELEDSKVNRAGDVMTGPLKVSLVGSNVVETIVLPRGMTIRDYSIATNYTTYGIDGITRWNNEIPGSYGILLPNKEGRLALESQVQDVDERLSSAIDGIREDIRNEAHFRGYLETNAEIQALAADANDYAYSAESGTVWVYQANTGWINSGRPVPDQMTPASDSTPLMDGTASAGTAAAYARGDHVHPTDTTLAKTIDGEVMYDGIEKTNTLLLHLYNSAGTLISTASVLLPAGGGSGDLSEYVKFTDYATDNVAGVLRGIASFGFKVDEYGRGAIVKAETGDIDSGVNWYKPIVPVNLKYAVKVGVTTNTETLTDKEKASSCEWLGAARKSDVENISEILDLAEITEVVETTSTYSTRVTAGGLTVIPGSTTTVKKVEGSTVASENKFDLLKVSADGQNVVQVTENYVVLGEALTTDGILLGAFSDLLPTVKVGDSIKFVVYNADAQTPLYISAFAFSDTNGTLSDCRSGQVFTVTSEMLNTDVNIFYDEQLGEATKIAIGAFDGNNNDVSTFIPYFAGLKNAEFAGIESKSADGTETSSFAFPKTATPLGVTIDFENEIITETYGDYTFTGNENWSKGASAPTGFERWYCSIPNMATDPGSGSYNYGMCDKYPVFSKYTEYQSTTSAGVVFGMGNNYLQFICKEGQTVQSVQALTKGMAVRYLLDPAYHTSTPFTTDQANASNTYVPYTGGAEAQAGNENAEYGANNTITQDYNIVNKIGG